MGNGGTFPLIPFLRPRRRRTVTVCRTLHISGPTNLNFLPVPLTPCLLGSPQTPSTCSPPPSARYCPRYRTSPVAPLVFPCLRNPNEVPHRNCMPTARHDSSKGLSDRNSKYIRADDGGKRRRSVTVVLELTDVALCL